MSDSFQIAYAAHTAACTFLLDADGICRRIVMSPASSKRSLSSKGRDEARAASQCVGTQYVATLDPGVSGMLAEMPRVGAAMLFARVDERGRVSLVRTGLVTRFESHRIEEDPFADRRPSESVRTSAPPIAAAIRPRRPAPPPEVRAVDFIRITDDEDDLETAEYQSEMGARRVAHLPQLAPPPTLRKPPVTLTYGENPYARASLPTPNAPQIVPPPSKVATAPQKLAAGQRYPR